MRRSRGRGVLRCAICTRTRRGRHRHGTDTAALVRGDVAEVQHDATGNDHGEVREQLGRVADLGRVPRGEVPDLRSRQFEETVAVRRR